MIPEIRLVDSDFAHHPANGTSISTSPNNNVNPTFFKWYRGPEARDITVFTGNHLHEASQYQNTTRIAWIIEPRSLTPTIYAYLEKHVDDFDMILTHDKSWILKELKNSFKARYMPLGGCWIKESDFGVHTKSKSCSIISSYKRQLDGHQMRHQIISQYRNQLDGIFGNGYMRLVDKVDGLKDYRFHIVIENTNVPGWWTEKLVDAFACGSIPIYWGNGGLAETGNFFNNDGIIHFNSVSDLDYIFKDFVNESYYQSKLYAVNSNMELAKKYRVMEDAMWHWHLKGLMQ